MGFGFQPSESPKYAAPARLIHGPKPNYPEEGKDAGIQGIVVLQVQIDERGIPAHIAILSPLGYGFDEAAVDAVRQWRCSPTEIDGKPVSVTTEVTIDFTLTGALRNEKAERQRTAYNVALAAIKQRKVTKATVDSLRNLCSQGFEPALYLYGKMLEEGRDVPADPEQGFRLIQESAEKQHGPARYEVAKARLKGDRLEQDSVKGLQLMQGAARLGSAPAQAYLGQAYEIGDGVPVDLEKSRQNFRLCAAAGTAVCQYRLGKSLLADAEHLKRDYIQAIAWLELASEQGNQDSEKLLQQEDPHLTYAQTSQADQLKTHLVHRP